MWSHNHDLFANKSIIQILCLLYAANNKIKEKERDGGMINRNGEGVDKDNTNLIISLSV